MSAANFAKPRGFAASINSDINKPHVIKSCKPEVFADIYLEQTNMVIWQRELSNTLKQAVAAFLKSNASFQLAMTVTPQSAKESLKESLRESLKESVHESAGQIIGDSNPGELSENIAELVDMFCYLFDLKRAGLRLTVLDRAMCPKFHVDHVPCRLITTFQGIATEWLPHEAVNREKLGAGSQGQPDAKSGLYQSQRDIQCLSPGDVALLKGEGWQGNENAGLVHRSPAVTGGERRLLLTLDFSE